MKKAIQTSTNKSHMYKLRFRCCSNRPIRNSPYLCLQLIKPYLKFQSNWHWECRLVAVRTVNVFLATLCGNRSGNELPKRPSVSPLIARLIVAISPTHRDAMQYH